MADFSKTVQIIFEGDDQASRKAADVIARVRELQQEEKEAAAQNKLADSFDAASAKATFFGLTANQVLQELIRFVTDAYKRFVEVNSAAESFGKSISAINGPATDVRVEFGYVTEVANRLGVGLLDVAKSYTGLSAATKGTALEGKQTKEIFEAVAQAMAATGKSSFETEGALKAIEQIASKGNVQMEELRGQLGDRLPGALTAAARAMGVTTSELEDLVKKGLSAEEFLPKFAGELNKTFGGASFDGYQQQTARLTNAVDELFIKLGRASGFDEKSSWVKGALTDAFQNAGLAVNGLSGGVDALLRLLRTGDWQQFNENLKTVDKQSQQAAASLDTKLNQSLAETNRLLAQARASTGNTSGDESKAETERLIRQNKLFDDSIKAASELDALLKRLGVDPKKFKDSIDEVAAALKSLTENPALSGDKFLAGFEAALKRVRTNGDINTIGAVLTEAFTSGKISAETFDAATKELAKTQQAVSRGGSAAAKGVDEQAKAMEKAAKEAEKAQERAEKFRLEIEKLASNERIKLIEARMTLDVTNVQEQTKRVQALLSSIDNTVKSTGELLTNLFGNLSKGFLDPSARRLVEEQIVAENKRRQDALDQQKALSEAQVAYLRAQVKAIDRGETLIKVDGAGLQPHLEAFMWEILKVVQVRVNAQGLNLLLGVPA